MLEASIIIPTYNSVDQLARALQSIVDGTLNAQLYEIIVVDNGSSDDTKSFVDTFIKLNTAHNIRYIYEDVPGLLSGRHRGAKESYSDILVFVDQDICADPNWLSSIVETFNRLPEVHLVGGKCLPKYEKEPPKWLDYFWRYTSDGGRYMDFLSLCDFGDEEKELNHQGIWGLNYSIRKKTLYECGGFNPDSFPPFYQYLQGDGESGLSFKMAEKGYKAYYNPKALVFHEVPAERMTLSYFDKRFFYQGICISYLTIRTAAQTQKHNLLKRSRKLAKKIKTKIEHHISPDAKNNDLFHKSSEFEKDMLVARFRAMEAAGYSFHQQVAKKNPFVMKWILKENYFDYTLPDLISHHDNTEPQVLKSLNKQY
jgi:glucosyl-dolichyl phosphate glucuronosyltransferase